MGNTNKGFNISDFAIKAGSSDLIEKNTGVRQDMLESSLQIWNPTDIQPICEIAFREQKLYNPMDPLTFSPEEFIFFTELKDKETRMIVRLNDVQFPKSNFSKVNFIAGTKDHTIATKSNLEDSEFIKASFNGNLIFTDSNLQKTTFKDIDSPNGSLFFRQCNMSNSTMNQVNLLSIGSVSPEPLSNMNWTEVHVTDTIVFTQVSMTNCLFDGVSSKKFTLSQVDIKNVCFGAGLPGTSPKQTSIPFSVSEKFACVGCNIEESCFSGELAKELIFQNVTLKDVYFIDVKNLPIDLLGNGGIKFTTLYLDKRTLINMGVTAEFLEGSCPNCHFFEVSRISPKSPSSLKIEGVNSSTFLTKMLSHVPEMLKNPYIHRFLKGNIQSGFTLFDTKQKQHDAPSPTKMKLSGITLEIAPLTHKNPESKPQPDGDMAFKFE